MTIQQHEIDATLQEFRNLTDGGIEKLIKSFQRKQEPLLVYIAAVVEREELNDHEYDLLITNVLLAWEVLRKKCGNVGKLRIEQLKQIDDEILTSEDSFDLNAQPGRNPQPALMQTIHASVLGAEPEVRSDRKSLILLTLNHLVIALNNATPGC